MVVFLIPMVALVSMTAAGVPPAVALFPMLAALLLVVLFVRHLVSPSPRIVEGEEIRWA